LIWEDNAEVLRWFSAGQQRTREPAGNKFRRGGNETTAGAVLSSSAATLPEVKACKTPSMPSGAGGVFIGSDVPAGAMRIICSEEVRRCPWLEVLLNVIGFAGLIAIAKYHKSRGEKLPDR
jgi:hypothetical protein